MKVIKKYKIIVVSLIVVVGTILSGCGLIDDISDWWNEPIEEEEAVTLDESENNQTISYESYELKDYIGKKIKKVIKKLSVNDPDIFNYCTFFDKDKDGLIDTIFLEDGGNYTLNGLYIGMSKERACTYMEKNCIDILLWRSATFGIPYDENVAVYLQENAGETTGLSFKGNYNEDGFLDENGLQVQSIFFYSSLYADSYGIYAAFDDMFGDPYEEYSGYSDEYMDEYNYFEEYMQEETIN